MNIKISILLAIAVMISACGDIPKEGDGTEKIEVKMELQYQTPADNETPSEEPKWILQSLWTKLYQLLLMS